MQAYQPSVYARHKVFSTAAHCHRCPLVSRSPHMLGSVAGRIPRLLADRETPEVLSDPCAFGALGAARTKLSTIGVADPCEGSKRRSALVQARFAARCSASAASPSALVRSPRTSAVVHARRRALAASLRAAAALSSSIGNFLLFFAMAGRPARLRGRVTPPRYRRRSGRGRQAPASARLRLRRCCRPRAPSRRCSSALQRAPLRSWSARAG